ncbi:MAG: UDP-N-acetylmuramoyl-L-alanyl-D-glutamate--2,6-diaminopimelate ligase [Candidatus Omnitrophota bacterium]
MTYFDSENINIVDDLLNRACIDKTNIKTDSRQVLPGDVFFAVKGAVFDGHCYICDVLKKGARIVFCEKKPSGLTQEELKRVITVNDVREALGYTAKHVFGNPSERINVFAVTGTNGKTTTVFLINALLNAHGNSSAFVSTVFTQKRNNLFARSVLTTPDVLTLNGFLSDMFLDGKNSAVIEVSSHALNQKRVYGINLDSAVFTNITPEHLDYHKNMTAYLNDKSKIFQNLKPHGLAVLNVDDPMVIGLKKVIDFPEFVGFGMSKDADIRAENVKLSASGLEFNLVVKGYGQVFIRSRLIGAHNVYNILSAVGAVINKDINLKIVKNALESFVEVPGRLEYVPSKAPFKVFVDYAHTPDALKNLLETLRLLTKRQLICVFGCGGNRDKSKRPLMGQIASKFCDKVILTNDNPRMEEPDEILKDIEKGMVKGSGYSIISQREDAIGVAINLAEPGDIVVIAGKGHENYQIIGSRVIPFDDREVVKVKFMAKGYM